MSSGWTVEDQAELDALAQRETPKVGSRWQHLKRGTTYQIFCLCVIEATGRAAVAYQSEHDGTIWVRPAVEFLDGRFSKIGE